jgi:pimeloyl-ACP methyl ester carboxylesterase
VLALPPADLYVSLNAHPGRPDVLTAWLDPAVTDESDPLSNDATLSMYHAPNGPPYAAAFVAEYREAQRARNERITRWAVAELARMGAAGVPDRLFGLYRVWADLRFADLTLDPSDRSPGCYQGDPRRANFGPFGIGAVSTLRTWLSMWSLAESQCRGEPHLARCAVPALVVQSTADRGVFPSDAEAIHAALGSSDRQLRFVPGEHYFESGGRAEVAELILKWAKERGQ